MLLATAAFACASRVALAQDADKPYISPVFGSNMVLQRKIPVPVWDGRSPDRR